MNEFNYDIKKIQGLNCPNKCLLTINGVDICFGNGKNSFRDVLDYAYTLDESKLECKKVKKQIKKALKAV